MPAETERYRFVRWEIEDVNGVARMLPGGIAEVTRGGGLKYERVVFLGPSGKVRTEVHLKRGHVRKLEQFGFASQVPDADGT
jgi:hypothetical protein